MERELRLMAAATRFIARAPSMEHYKCFVELDTPFIARAVPEKVLNYVEELPDHLKSDWVVLTFEWYQRQRGVPLGGAIRLWNNEVDLGTIELGSQRPDHLRWPGRPKPEVWRAISWWVVTAVRHWITLPEGVLGNLYYRWDMGRKPRLYWRDVDDPKSIVIIHEFDLPNPAWANLRALQRRSDR